MTLACLRTCGTHAGLYRGFTITVLRDIPSYGVYFSECATVGPGSHGVYQWLIMQIGVLDPLPNQPCCANNHPHHRNPRPDSSAEPPS